MSKKIFNGSKSREELTLFSFTKQRAIRYLVTGLSFWFLTLIVYIIPDLDHQILLLFNDMRAYNLFAAFWSFYTENMPYFFGGFILALYIASYIFPPLKPFRMALFVAIVIYVIGSPLVNIIKEFVRRPRPFVTYPDITFFDEVSVFSFPSRHAFTAFAETITLMTALVTKNDFFKPTINRYVCAFILIAIAVSMSLSRIFAGVHYLSDILFSVGLAIILEVTIILSLQKVLEKKWLTIKNEKIIAGIFVVLIVIVVNVL